MKGIYCYYDNLRCEIVYIGKDSHIDRNKRHGEHYQKSRKDEQVINKNLQNDNKSGRYSYAVLEQGDFTKDELNQKEISWIAFFNPKFCFTEGGDGFGSGDKHINFDPCIKIKKHKNNKCKQGFTWIAQPVGSEGQEYISNINLLECMKLVEEFIDSEKNIYRYETFKVVGFIYGVDEINYKKDSSGANHSQFDPCLKIRKRKDNTYKQGFYWRARPYTQKKRITLSSVDLQKCIEKVKKFIDSDENVLGYETFKVIYD